MRRGWRCWCFTLFLFFPAFTFSSRDIIVCVRVLFIPFHLLTYTRCELSTKH
jgi:hypothetical protein